MNTNDLLGPAHFQGSIARILQGQLKAQPNFTPANQAFSNETANPFLQMGSGGNVLDPRQMQQSEATNYLGQRGAIASNDIQQKMGFADLLNSAGANKASIMNLIPLLNAQQTSGQTSAFGSLLGGVL